MKISKNQYFIIFLAFVSFILLISIFKWADYLSNNNYIRENFEPDRELYNDAISHTVDLPLTTTYSCRNFCGPNSRCSITGQQCTADIDCPGCQPYSPPLPKNKDGNVPGDNDAGKLTLGVTPQYSSLTSGYGTKEKLITSNIYEKPGSKKIGYYVPGTDIKIISDNDIKNKK